MVMMTIMIIVKMIIMMMMMVMTTRLAPHLDRVVVYVERGVVVVVSAVEVPAEENVARL